MQFGEFICCCDLRLRVFCLFITIPCGSFHRCSPPRPSFLVVDRLRFPSSHNFILRPPLLPLPQSMTMLDDMWLHYLSVHCMRSRTWHSGSRCIFWKLWSDLWSRCWKSMHTVVDMRDPNGAECGIYGILALLAFNQRIDIKPAEKAEQYCNAYVCVWKNLDMNWIQMAAEPHDKPNLLWRPSASLLSLVQQPASKSPPNAAVKNVIVAFIMHKQRVFGANRFVGNSTQTNNIEICDILWTLAEFSQSIRWLV